MRAAVIFAVGACIAFAGCGRSDNNKTVTYSSQNGNVTVSSSGNGEHMVIQSDNGKASVEINTNGLGHVDLPPFAPLYPGAKVISSVTGADKNGSRGSEVTFTTSAAPGDVIAFYKQRADGAGLTQTMNMQEGNAMMMAASKDKKSVTITATKSGDGTQVLLIWGSD